MIFNEIKKKINQNFYDNKIIIFDQKNQIKSLEKLNA